MWLGIFLLFALLIFIVWDSRRLRNAKPEPLAREVLARGFLPNGLVAWHFHLGLGGVLALLAFLEWERPSTPPLPDDGPGCISHFLTLWVHADCLRGGRCWLACFWVMASSCFAAKELERTVLPQQTDTLVKHGSSSTFAHFRRQTSFRATPRCFPDSPPCCTSRSRPTV